MTCMKKTWKRFLWANQSCENGFTIPETNDVSKKKNWLFGEKKTD